MHLAINGDSREFTGDLRRSLLDFLRFDCGLTGAKLEPHATLAERDGERLTVDASLQMLRYNLDELSDSPGLPLGKVRLLTPHVGGGFGSKLGVNVECVAAAVAAMELRRPLGVSMSRQTVFQSTSSRSETRRRDAPDLSRSANAVCGHRHRHGESAGHRL